MTNSEPTSPKYKQDDEIERYGLFFPDHISDVGIELKCYKNNHPVELGGLGAAGHLRNAISLLFPQRYIWHDWIDRRLDDWCSERFVTWWGPAASAKSTDAAMLALVDWWADPLHTTTIICSTTLKMLRRRIFGEVVKYHHRHRDSSPGTYLKSKTAIVIDPDKTGETSEQSGIFGFAVQLGDQKEAKDDIIGQHNKRIRLIIDEAQHPALEVAFDARSNLMKGCEDFKLIAFGNPDSRLDPLGRHSEPVDGWDSVTPDDEEWRTKLGKTSYFDGMKSPAVKEPEKFSFLINKSDIDDTIEDKGFDSPDYWQFCRGFVRAEGSSFQIISETFAIQHKMIENPEWLDTFQAGAGFDPAYSSGGDKAIFIPFQFGMSTWGAKIISFLLPVRIFVEVSKLKEKTQLSQLSEKVIENCKKHAIKKIHFGMDITGAQSLLADRIDELWDEEGSIHRTQFGGAATNMQASVNDPTPSCDVYANRVTELWFNMVAFARYDQIRRLPAQALKEFTIREIVRNENKRMRTLKRQIEPKPLMKARTGGKSPDDADAACICLDVARQVLDIHPGMSSIPKKSQESDDFAREYDLDSSDDLYLTDGY